MTISSGIIAKHYYTARITNSIMDISLKKATEKRREATEVAAACGQSCVHTSLMTKSQTSHVPVNVSLTHHSASVRLLIDPPA
jgi:hypothetical protein